MLQLMCAYATYVQLRSIFLSKYNKFIFLNAMLKIHKILL
jgi:hypothetical protein